MKSVMWTARSRVVCTALMKMLAEVLWDAKSFEVSDPRVWVLGSNVFRGFGCGGCVCCAEAAKSIMAVSLQQRSPGLLAGVP